MIFKSALIAFSTFVRLILYETNIVDEQKETMF